MATTISFAVRSSAAGAALALGAPSGWLAFQAFHGWRPGAAIASSPELYAYLLVGPLLAFSAFGWWLGRRDDQLAHARDDLATRNATLSTLALTDSLTGLGNRRTFAQRLEEELARARRTSRPLAAVMLDLDRFKDVNDRFGHPVGDQVLQRASQLIASHAREIDVVCRVGGEEFAVLCPAATLQQATAVAERIRAAIAASPLFIDSGPIPITVSAGVAQLQGEEPAEQLIRRADQALYRAKAAGRNAVEIAVAPCAASAMHTGAPTRRSS